MAFVDNDPRAKLTSTASTKAVSTYGRSSYANFYETSPQVETSHCRTWLTRGQNFLVAYSLVDAGGQITRRDQSQEHVLLLPDGDLEVRVRAGGEELVDSGRSLIVVPPGDSTIDVLSGGRVVEMLPTLDDELTSLCSNA